MKLAKKILAPIGSLFVVLVIFHLFASEALAGESESGWRSSYDLIMMWLNFAILVGVFIKFGKNPIKGFFKDQRENISRTIGDIEAQKQENLAQIQQTQQLMQENSDRFESIKKKIIVEGETKKQDIIETARRESQLMIDHANFWIERQVLQAKQKLKSELIDDAFRQALQRLPKALTLEDKQKIINRYLAEIDNLSP
jgi:F-type H+-transporting ATPase subunit b